MDKIAALAEILMNDPRNAFARYGFAMEHAARGQYHAACEEFDTLLSHHSDYTAGYFMSAQTLLKANRAKDAIARLKEGIACAQRTQDTHTEAEMRALLDEVDR